MWKKREVGKPLTIDQIAARDCIDRCEGMGYGFPYHTQLAIECFRMVQDQIIPSFNGAVGYNHIPIHQYLQMQEFDGPIYRFLFHEILRIGRMYLSAVDAQHETTKNNKTISNKQTSVTNT